MKILAIDSSGQVASAALTQDNQLLGEISINHKINHSVTLLPMLSELVRMTELDLSSIDGIAVAAGPGSFTGLRIGAAMAKGLGFALQKPLLPISTLEGLAYNLYGAKDLICPLMDARRNQVYTGVYEFVPKANSENEKDSVPSAEMILREDLQNKNEREASLLSYYALQPHVAPCALGIADITDKLNAIGRRVLFLGDGANVFADYLKEHCKISFGFAPAHLNRQRAGALAALGMEYLVAGKSVPASEFVPEYLRLSQAERERLEKEQVYT
ncbi:tRNA (adenosine(37)-N6)-threonylcarbamoyltransferase complex dimerization subunit type 1 TsaB [Clostridia bacterium]|nr:tRNA (adenosine(37)-N6)-threonylcarbamoyltransferase complex dimerization subunit type 1 TsaB [Clostridia bacterium]